MSSESKEPTKTGVVESADVAADDYYRLPSLPDIKFDFSPEDRQYVNGIKDALVKQIRWDFAQAFEAERKLDDKVRSRLPIPQGGGYVVNSNGSYVEDWSQVTLDDMREFILAGSQFLFQAKQKAVDIYVDAAFSKYAYDDKFYESFNSIFSGTDKAKKSAAEIMAVQERWHALYRSIYNKMANECVDAFEEHVRRVDRIYQSEIKVRELENKGAITGTVM